MKIINSQGQVLISETTKNIDGTFEKQINMQNYAKGIYFVKLKTIKGVEVNKIIIK